MTTPNEFHSVREVNSVALRSLRRRGVIRVSGLYDTDLATTADTEIPQPEPRLFGRPRLLEATLGQIAILERPDKLAGTALGHLLRKLHVASRNLGGINGHITPEQGGLRVRHLELGAGQTVQYQPSGQLSAIASLHGGLEFEDSLGSSGQITPGGIAFLTERVEPLQLTATAGQFARSLLIEPSQTDRQYL